MSTSIVSHIPVLSVPTFKSLGAYDPALVDVLEPEEEFVAEATEEERLQAEFQRGLSEGEERTRSHYEALLEKERDAHAKALEEEHLRFDMREAANISAAIDGFLNVVEQRISYSIARLLQPFLKEKIIEQLVHAFTGNLRQIAQECDGKLIRLSGPETLVRQVLEQMPGLREQIEVQVSDQVELVALLDDTTVETRLGQWLSQLDDLEKESD
ncbi:hypothetical protein [Roseibium aggregatum]|uniref:Flagellar assembly protein FliH n=1 Tax=Roseibium aggregatum TaxID=187304 RepID=A0A939ECN1_9HYPH|nr:hypothetical protein [Roseibium aggregatum]MBN9670730.1 hypothetical protein [Roseibium aggregatum]